jgi:hypothetical protein
MKIAAHGLGLELSPVNALDGEDWCRVRVLAAVAGFEADFVAYLQGADLVRFRDSINAMYEVVGQPGEAVLGSAEPGVSIVLSMARLGGISGKYKFEGEFVEGGAPTLMGGFEMDQSYLPALLDGIDRLLAELKGHET